jgi:hypothetical protein
VFANRSDVSASGVQRRNGDRYEFACFTVEWPKLTEPARTKLSLSPQALAMLTDGVDLRGAKMRPWYEREESETRGKKRLKKV